jgi:hypothetical protein
MESAPETPDGFWNLKTGVTATLPFHTDHHHVQWCFEFTFSIPCITVRFVQSEPMNAHSFIKVTILQHSTFYMFQASLAHHQSTQLDKTFSACSRTAENSSICNICSRPSCALKTVIWAACSGLNGTYREAQNSKCVLSDAGPVLPETCRSWCFVILLWFQ